MPQKTYVAAKPQREWMPGVCQLISILAFSTQIGCGPREIVVSLITVFRVAISILKKSWSFLVIFDRPKIGTCYNTFQRDGGLVDLDKYPRLAKYLESHKDALKKRHVAKKNNIGWFRTIDRVYAELVQQPKLLIPDIAGANEVAYEGGRYYPHHKLGGHTDSLGFPNSTLLIPEVELGEQTLPLARAVLATA